MDTKTEQSNFNYKNQLHGIWCILRDEGIKALFRGYVMRCVYAGTLTTFNMTSTELIKNYLNNKIWEFSEFLPFSAFILPILIHIINLIIMSLTLYYNPISMPSRAVLTLLTLANVPHTAKIVDLQK